MDSPYQQHAGSMPHTPLQDGIRPHHGRHNRHDSDAQSTERELRDVPSVIRRKRLTFFAWLKSLLKLPDRILLQLNRLLKPAEDFGAVLSTAYYIVRSLGFLHEKSVALLTRYTFDDHEEFSYELVSAPNPITKSANLLWNARMTLRLFKLLSIYARGREIVNDSKPKDDKVIYATSLIQCALCGISQVLENIAFLTERKILPRSMSHYLTKTHDGKLSIIYTLAYRAWFLATTCDALCVARKVQMTYQHHVFRIEDSAHKWWHFDFLLPMAWFPIGWQLSAWNEIGNPGFNAYLHQAACVLADFEKTWDLWKSAKPV